MSRTRPLGPAALALVAAVLVACGGPTPSAGAGGATQGPASVAASQAPSGSAAPTPDSSGLSSLPPVVVPSQSADRNLEALLPGSFGGASLQKFSLRFVDFASQATAKDYEAVARALGVSPDDITIAYAGDATGTVDVQFLAVRFPGADPARVAEVFKGSIVRRGETITTLTLGGKSALVSSADATRYSYFKADMVLGVIAPDRATAALALEVMP